LVQEGAQLLAQYDANIAVTNHGIILEFDSTGFDATRVFSPAITKVGNQYLMLYAGEPFGNNIQIGLATSADGLTWTKSLSDPVISNANSPSWAPFREAPVTLMYENGLYEVYFFGNGSGGLKPPPHQTSPR